MEHHAVTRFGGITRLEADATTCQQKLAELTAGIQQLIHNNQHTACDRDVYQAQYAALEAQHQKTAARKQAIDADIAAKHAKHAAVTTALQQLEYQPLDQFHPSQWSALIDHATIDKTDISFIFRTGQTITINIPK